MTKEEALKAFAYTWIGKDNILTTSTNSVMRISSSK